MQFSSHEILETISMVQMENLDIRTITMGISLRDCAHPDLQTAASRAYDKICRKAARLVRVGEEIEHEYGIPIINKRISVTPIAIGIVTDFAAIDSTVNGDAPNAHAITIELAIPSRLPINEPTSKASQLRLSFSS